METKYSEKTVVGFLTFYIHHFKQDDLEVISQYDTDHHVTELNAFIFWDRNFRLKDIVPLLVQRRSEIITLLLDDLIANAHLDIDKMKSERDWENWYNDEKMKIRYPDR